jgi:hypothetical protein
MPIKSAQLIEELYVRVQAAQKDGTVDPGELLWDDFPNVLVNLDDAAAVSSPSSKSAKSSVAEKAREMIAIAEQVLSSKEMLLLCLSMRPTLAQYGDRAKFTLLRVLTTGE